MLPGVVVPRRVNQDLTLIKSVYRRDFSDLHQTTRVKGFDDQW